MNWYCLDDESIFVIKNPANEFSILLFIYLLSYIFFINSILSLSSIYSSLKSIYSNFTLETSSEEYFENKSFNCSFLILLTVEE